MYRNYIIYILLNTVGILDQLSRIVIEKILSDILSFHINKANDLFHSDTIKANTNYNSALYIANRIEDHEKRILIPQALEEISHLLGDDSLAEAHKDKAIEIERAMKGLPPDFSEYKSSFNLRPHISSDEDKETN
jgi:hypothetical protein